MSDPGGVQEVVFVVLGLAVSAAHGYALARVLYAMVAARSWERVPGAVEELRRRRLSGGVEAAGAGATGRHVRQIEVRYRYRYRGAAYRGRHVNPLDYARLFSAIVVYNDDAALYRNLEEAKAVGAAVPVWVDPRRPARSLLSRRVPPGRLVYLATVSVAALALTLAL
ncbi:MAG: DUF3592 domain-containing protein [Nitrospirae bacterium]|nr:MAG: DUF3592 domain-containing protein [Nitrospirota bacterium]